MNKPIWNREIPAMTNALYKQKILLVLKLRFMSKGANPEYFKTIKIFFPNNKSFIFEFLIRNVLHSNVQLLFAEKTVEAILLVQWISYSH